MKKKLFLLILNLKNKLILQNKGHPGAPYAMNVFFKGVGEVLKGSYFKKEKQSVELCCQLEN